MDHSQLQFAATRLKQLTTEAIATVTSHAEALFQDKVTQQQQQHSQRGIAKRKESTMHLPYLGETSTDVVLFVASAMVFRAYLWWRKRQQRRGGNANNRGGGSSVVRSTPLPPGYKDPGLYAFMDKAKERRMKLRKVEDPEIGRKKKMQQIRTNNGLKPKGPLGISKDLLQNKLKSLKETGRSLVEEEKEANIDELPV